MESLAEGCLAMADNKSLPKEIDSINGEYYQALPEAPSLLSHESWSTIWLREVKQQCWIACPMIGVNLLQFCVQLVSLMFVGHLGQLSLSSASIAVSFANVSGFSLLIGMGSALETLCGQAYGAHQYHLLGIYMQRAIFVLAITCIPIAVVWYNMGGLLVALGQDPMISIEAGKYARWMLPGLFAYSCLQPLVIFLQTQSTVFPMLLGSCITLSIHIPLCWTLIYKLNMGNKGAALSTSISNWINVALLVLYVKFSSTCKKTWTTFSTEAFHDLKQFFKLAIPSAIMICLEWWSFETLVLLSGVLPRPALETSVFSIGFNTVGLVCMIPFGLSAAVSTRVSNELGAGHPLAARLSTYIALSLGLLDAIFVSATLFLLRNVLGWGYSSEKEVVEYVAKLVPFIACISVLDAVQGVLSGVVRGCGWQTFAALTNLGAYYVVGLPIAYLLAFKFQVGAKGLWLGVLCGGSTQMMFMLTSTVLTNWEKQAQEARDRVYSSSLLA